MTWPALKGVKFAVPAVTICDPWVTVTVPEIDAIVTVAEPFVRRTVPGNNKDPFAVLSM
jgi:hypothetical protein